MDSAPPQPQQNSNTSKQLKKKTSKGKVKDEQPVKEAIVITDGSEPPRTGRACLACRKLKTRCEDSDNAPCKRCRLGGHECVFVESKRGKRPARKPADPTLAEKFRNVEKTLSVLLSSMSTGAAPDPAALAQLQASLKEGLAADAAAQSGKPSASTSRGGASNSNDLRSPSSDSPAPNKRPRFDPDSFDGPSPPSATTASPYAHTLNLSPQTTAPGSGRLPHLALSTSDGTPRLSDSSSLTSAPPSISGVGGLGSTGQGGSGPGGQGNSLAMLADASLAAQIDGRSTMQGLDASFNLSRVTEALEERRGLGMGGEEGEQTPKILSKGIVSPEEAVELFKLYFEWVYIHLPGLDPVYDSATSVCARSPFLFTVICAVASRFNPNPALHVACYDEAHAAFLEMISEGKRSVENVQACLIMTVWGSAPKQSEDRPQRASLYFGQAVRMALELGLFRPPAWVDAHLAAGNAGKANPWANIKGVSEADQRDALNRERTWLLVFVIDRNISAVMGRPYQIHEAKPLLMPLHPLSLPFDLGLLAHSELQVINGQVMDTFRDRIYGLSSASDEMPSAVVMKIFNSRMDEWKQRWCPVPGEPIANILLYYFYSSKLFLNTIPLHTMLRNGDVSDDPECVSTCLNAAKSMLDLGHKYAELGVLTHCPDVNFLLLLYAAVFLVKVKASGTRFAELVDTNELQMLLVQAIQDCQAATTTDRHAASTSYTLLRAVLASWKQMMAHGGAGSGNGHSRAGSLYGGEHVGATAAETSPQLGAPAAPSNGLGLHGTLAGAGFTVSGPPTPAPYPFANSPFAHPRPSNGYFGGSAAPSVNGDHPMEPVDTFLTDTGFFNSMLISQGADGFFQWSDSMDTATALDLDFNNLAGSSLDSLGSAEPRYATH